MPTIRPQPSCAGLSLPALCELASPLNCLADLPALRSESFHPGEPAAPCLPSVPTIASNIGPLSAIRTGIERSESRLGYHPSNP